MIEVFEDMDGSKAGLAGRHGRSFVQYTPLQAYLLSRFFLSFFSLSLDGKDDGRHHADGISRYYEVYEDSEGRQA